MKHTMKLDAMTHTITQVMSYNTIYIMTRTIIDIVLIFSINRIVSVIILKKLECLKQVYSSHILT